MKIEIFFLVVYICACAGVVIYVLSLLGRFVKAHERIAKALEKTGRQF